MKYMGNKQKIADEILTVIFNDSKKTDTFVDLFCGSCSIIERVPDSYIKIANDKNKFLIEMLKSLTYKPKEQLQVARFGAMRAIKLKEKINNLINKNNNE